MDYYGAVIAVRRDVQEQKDQKGICVVQQSMTIMNLYCRLDRPVVDGRHICCVIAQISATASATVTWDFFPPTSALEPPPQPFVTLCPDWS
jgi:hypothetical protein